MEYGNSIVERLNSLEEKLHETPTSIERIDLLNALAQKNSEGDTNRAIEWAAEALELARHLNYERGIINGLLNLAWCWYCQSNYLTSIQYVTQALALTRAEHYPREEADAINILGNNHERMGNWQDALDCYLEALYLSEEQDNRAHIAVMRSNIGDIYALLGQYQKAIEHYQESYRIDREIDHVDASAGLTLTYMAEAYLGLGDSNLALDYARQGLALMQPDRFWAGIARALMVIGQTCVHANDGAKAINYYEKALAAALHGGAQREAGISMMRLAEILARIGQSSGALSHFQQALKIFEALDIQPLIVEAHGHLTAIYKHLGNYERALDHTEQQQILKEKFFNQQTDMRIRTLQTQYEVERIRLEAEAQASRNRVLEEEIDLRGQMIGDLESYADNIAHDLKNPIAVITTYMELLDADLAGIIPEENRRAIRNVMATAIKMNTIVESLLTLARVRKQAIMPQSIDMNEVLTRSIQRLELPIQQRNAHIHVERPLPPALGHEIWLEEVWVNYIGNAIKYGGTPPEIHIGSTPENNNLVRYWVGDNGKGLSPDEQAHLFQKFERLGQTNIDGHGLGLTIIKTVVERLGGSVGVTSSGIPGQGSTFSFTLPAANMDDNAGQNGHVHENGHTHHNGSDHHNGHAHQNGHTHHNGNSDHNGKDHS